MHVYIYTDTHATSSGKTTHTWDVKIEVIYVDEKYQDVCP